MSGRAAPGRRRARGQYIPVFMVLLMGMFGFMVVIYNVLGFQSAAAVALEGAIHGAAYAAAQQANEQSEGGRWLINGDTATDTAREMLARAIVGSDETTSAATGALSSLFRDCSGGDCGTETRTLSEMAAATGGTESLTRYGIDVEILNPAIAAGQTSERWTNGTESESAGILCSVDYPQQVASLLLDGRCFDRPMVAIRVHLPARQLGVSSVAVTRTGYLAVGTDTAPSAETSPSPTP